MSKTTQAAISQKRINQTKNKKKLSCITYFYTCVQFLAQNSKYKWPKVFAELFDIWKIGT